MHPFQGLSTDLRAVLRSLRRSPGYAATAVLSLAIGMGANTAMFGIIRQLLVAPLAVDQPEGLRLVYWRAATDGPFSFGQLNATGYRDSAGAFYRSNYSYPEFTAMRASLGKIAAIAGYNRVNQLTVTMPVGGSASAAGLVVSGGFLTTLRPPIAYGRALVESDDLPGAPAVAVIGHGFWMRAFGGDPATVGRLVAVNGVPVTIVGITGERYRGLSPGGFAPDTDVTIAFALQPQVVPEWTERGTSLFTDRNQKWVRVIARITDGSDAAASNALTSALRTEMPGAGMTADQAATVSATLFRAPRGLDSLRRDTATPLRVLSGVLGIVLVIACVNVAGLMLARGVAKQRELAVRRALGASRLRLAREMLAESGLLAAAGAVCGLVLALATAPVTSALVATGLGATRITVRLDWPLLGAAAGLACFAGIVTGLLPALRFTGRDSTLLRDRTTGTGAPRLRIGRALLTLQIAVSLPLVTGAGLFLRTLHNFGRIDLGFEPRGLVLFQIDPTLNGKAPERVASIFPRILEEVEAIPGVTTATLMENALMTGVESDSTATIGDRQINVYVNSVGPKYLETMGVPLVSGRSVSHADAGRGTASVVINTLTASKYFGPGSPIGQHFRISRRDVEVVGVSSDSRYDALRNATPPTVLFSYLQRPVGGMWVVVRAAVPAASLRQPIQDAITRVDPALPVTRFRTQTDQIDETIGRERVFARVLTAFGAFALILACLGLHGVTSYWVARRTSELAVRLALGAQRPQVMWLVLRQVMGLAIIGLAVGLPLAWLATPLFRAFLFGVEPMDPLTIATSALILFVVAIIAGGLPSRRASRLQVLSAIRTE